eukprot:Lankesteria_metandrocarpae@DN2623_c0_g1_i2.p1
MAVFRSVLSLLGVALSVYANQQEAKVTHTTYFDLQIGTGPVERITFGLYGDITPKTAANFFELCRGYDKNGRVLTYKNTSFHRIIHGFMAQGGDFTNHNGTGGECIFQGSTKFDDENFQVKHNKGLLLSMANAGPHTNGSQFFITFKQTPWLDGGHVVFGEVVDGADIMQRIEAVGNPSGQPQSKVTVVDSGVVVKPQQDKFADFQVTREGVVHIVR